MDTSKVVVPEVQEPPVQHTPYPKNRIDEFDFIYGDADYDVNRDDHADCWCGD